MQVWQCDEILDAAMIIANFNRRKVRDGPIKYYGFDQARVQTAGGWMDGSAMGGGHEERREGEHVQVGGRGFPR